MARQAVLVCVLGAFGVSTLAMCSCAVDPFYEKYTKIQKGMLLKEVEAILGKGKRIKADEVPKTPDSSKPEGGLIPVVKGDVFYQWLGTKSDDGPNIIIGFEKGKVVAKRYWSPSL